MWLASCSVRITAPSRRSDQPTWSHTVYMKHTALAIAFATLGLSANAAVISFEAPLNLATTEINQNLSLGMFDSTLGTLESISLELLGQAISTASIQNNAAQAQNFGFTSTLNLVFSGGPLSEIIQLALFDTGTITGADGLGRILIEAGQTYELGTVDVGKSLVLSVDAANFAAFIGTDALSLNCESLVSNTQVGGGGNISVNQATQAGCGARVTYTYSDSTSTANPVPEPGSLALLGLGLVGLAGLRRKTR